MTFGFSSSTNANAGIDADIIEIAGFPLRSESLILNLSLTQNYH